MISRKNDLIHRFFGKLSGRTASGHPAASREKPDSFFIDPRVFT